MSDNISYVIREPLFDYAEVAPLYTLLCEKCLTVSVCVPGVRLIVPPLCWWLCLNGKMLGWRSRVPKVRNLV